VWKDERNGNIDIYAQRIDASDVPLWAVDGVPVCTAAGDQISNHSDVEEMVKN